MFFELYQIKDELAKEFAFIGLEQYEKSQGTNSPKREHYVKVAEGEREKEDDVYSFLENRFREFNVDHPETYRGRSLSVSDIVKVNGEYFYCDLCGWERVSLR